MAIRSITTTADCELLEQAEKLGITRSEALELGLKELLAEKEGTETREQMRIRLGDKIMFLNNKLQEANDKCEQLKSHSQGISSP